MQLYMALIGALTICQCNAEARPNIGNQENDVKIPVSVQNEPDNKVDATAVNNATPIIPNKITESDLKRTDLNAVEIALNGGGIQNITVNNLIDENGTASDGKPRNVFKGGIIGTSTVKNVDAKEKALIENAVVLTGNGVADAPFVADDVIGESSTKSNLNNESRIVTGNAQFGKDIQARATDDTTEKSNKTFPNNISYVDYVDKKTGFITRLKKTETSNASDVDIANQIKKLIEKSKENIKDDAKPTGNSSLVQKPEQLKVNLLKNK